MIKRVFSMSNDKMGYIFLILFEIIYSFNYFYNTFPLSEGWFVNYVNLINDGYIPYKDYYYYLPPLCLAIDWCFFKMSFGFLLLFRGWYLVQRICIYLIMYYIIKKEFSWKISLVACAFAEVLCTADPFDYFGDYNQTVVLLGELLIVCFLKIVNGEFAEKQNKYVFFSGFILGLMFLCKQTIFITGSLMMICGYALLYKIKIIKGYKSIFFCMLGFAIPVFVTLAILACNNALLPFFQQVFSADGKGGLLEVVLLKPAKILKYLSYWVMALMAYKIFFYKKNECAEKEIKYIAWLLLLLLVDFFGIKKCAYLIMSFFCSWKIDLIIALFALLLWKNNKWFSYIKESDYLKLLLMTVVVLSILTMTSGSIYHAVYNVNLIDVINSKLFIVLFYIAIIIIYKKSVKIFIYDNYNKHDIYMIVTIFGGMIISYTQLMALGFPIIPASSMRILFPILLAIIFSIKYEKIQKFSGYVLGGVCGALVIVCIAQKSMSPYPWWGMEDVPKEERIYSVDNKAMAGIRVSKDDKEMIEGITNIINTYSTPDDVVFGYPYIKMFNVLTDRRKSYFVPVLWYDVVSDRYVDESMEEIANNPPKIIIWKDIPNAIEAHEKIYRKGKPLRQRELEEMLDDMIDERYEFVEEYNDIRVFVRND